MWLPRLETIRSRRKFYCRLLLGFVLVLTALLLVALSPGLIALATGEAFDAGLMLKLLGGFGAFITAFLLVLLKVESCNDVLFSIEFYLSNGDEKGLKAAFGNLSCLGEMKGIISEASGLANAVAK